jgi:hypothetical protein
VSTVFGWVSADAPVIPPTVSVPLQAGLNTLRVTFVDTYLRTSGDIIVVTAPDASDGHGATHLGARHRHLGRYRVPQ